MLYKINIGVTKISILLLYIRLFVKRWFLITCWTWIGIISAFTIGTVFSSIFQCTPVQYAFNKTLDGTCIDLTAFWFANASFNILSDLVIIALPVPVISKLQLPLKSKIALCCLFAVGILCGPLLPLPLQTNPDSLSTCITSILRITTLDIATSHLDTTWNSIGSSMWTVIESNLGIICACLPALRRPLGVIFPYISGRVNRSWGYSGPPRPDTRSQGSRTRPLNPAPKKYLGWSVLDETVVTVGDRSQVDEADLRIEDNAVRKTTEVIVEYNRAGEGTRNGGIEMGRYAA